MMTNPDRTLHPVQINYLIVGFPSDITISNCAVAVAINDLIAETVVTCPIARMKTPKLV